MAVKTTIRTPMPVKMRAKQFMMFDAMKGLTESIADKERCCYPQRELSEERIAELESIISSLQVGVMVSVTYYCGYSHGYKRISGVVNKIGTYWKQILVDGIVIEFCDIYRIDVDQTVD